VATQEEIEAILKSICKRRDSWIFSTRWVNLLTLIELGIDQDEILEIIDQTLDWRDYVEGPEADNHVPPIPGNIWIFGLNVDLYLKFQDRPEGPVIWISIHQANYPMNFPYK